MKARSQNLLDFTVQIISKTENRIVGTGIVVSEDGKVLTCLHVARMAGVEPKHNANATKISVSFPKNRYRERIVREAELDAHFPNYDDDIAILQLINPPPLSSQQIAILGTAEFSSGNSFRSYGFRQLGDSPSGYAIGEIMGSVLPFTNKNLLVDPIELRTRDIRPGMSGAGVLDIERNLVIGLVAQRWNPGEQSANDNVAWAVDNFILTFKPLKLARLIND